jgi:hypothetical protein
VATPSPPTRPFSDQYLFDYSNEHVAYEVDHFFWLAQILGAGSLVLGAPSPEDGARLNNILIEGFVIHLRNVIDFLYVKPQPTDVVAEDFFSPGDWQKLRPSITATLDAARTRANKEIAHLTTDRMAGSPPAKAWNFTSLADELRPILKLFASNVLPTRLGPNVAKAIR